VSIARRTNPRSQQGPRSHEFATQERPGSLTPAPCCQRCATGVTFPDVPVPWRHAKSKTKPRQKMKDNTRCELGASNKMQFDSDSNSIGDALEPANQKPACALHDCSGWQDCQGWNCRTRSARLLAHDASARPQTVLQTTSGQQPQLAKQFAKLGMVPMIW